MNSISNKAAIVGIGISNFTEDSGQSELYMACDVIKSALDDAGLVPDDIDGIVKHTDDASDELEVMRSLGGGNIAFQGECRWDGAGCGMVMRAAIGITAGMANYILVYRSVNGSSKRRMGTSMRDIAQMSTGDLLQWTFHAPFGLMTETGRMAMVASRYMHACGATNDQFGSIATVFREHGASNPGSRYYQQPITIDDYLKSPMIVDPLRQMDCREDADAAVAFVITTRERAADLVQKPAHIVAAAQSQIVETEEKNSFYGPKLAELPEIGRVGEKLYNMAGVSPKDIHIAQLDDSYAPLVPMQLEALGFCSQGEGAAFCENGDRIRAGGSLVLNTAGGSLGEGHIYGLNHIVEAVRQIRGTSSNQVNDADRVLVTTGAGGPASGLILGGN
ncbi:lipid-transfer protein [Chloroflexota bacterium]